VNHEHRLMLQFAPDYDVLPLMAKVEVFEHALDNTSGNDLNKVLWLKSRSSEVWLDRRTNYTRSLAVMSMVSRPGHHKEAGDGRGGVKPAGKICHFREG
jgi:FKBP12-rapamycin complex-associated protein